MLNSTEKPAIINIDYPWRVNGRGRTSLTDTDKHITQMLEQLLFTNPGERVNRPDFGSGLQQLVFAPTSPELAAALQFTLKAAIQRWLSDVLDLQSLIVTSEESTLSITIQYVVRRTGDAQTDTFTRTTVS